MAKGLGEEEQQSQDWEEMCEGADADPSEGLGLAQLREVDEDKCYGSNWFMSGKVRKLHAQLPQPAAPEPAAQEPAIPEGDPFGAELASLKLAALKRRAKALGASAEQIDGLDETDSPKAAAIELVIALRAALDGMNLGGLKKRLRALGTPGETVDELDESDDPKGAAIVLILQLATGAPAA